MPNVALHSHNPLPRGWASDSMNPALHRLSDVDRLHQEVRLLREEIRIKDARMEHIEAQSRPHDPPTERLAILELRAARSWSLAQTARNFLVTPLTIASWTARLDDEGADALVRLPEPFNRFPEFVGYVVRRLKVLCPAMGRVRIARVLARAGLHLGPTTVRRMLRTPRPPKPIAAPQTAPRIVTARKPNDLWHGDLTCSPFECQGLCPTSPVWVVRLGEAFSSELHRRLPGEQVTPRHPPVLPCSHAGPTEWALQGLQSPCMNLLPARPCRKPETSRLQSPHEIHQDR